jgi:hypothetical protein
MTKRQRLKIDRVGQAFSGTLGRVVGLVSHVCPLSVHIILWCEEVLGFIEERNNLLWIFLLTIWISISGRLLSLPEVDIQMVRGFSKL